MGNEAFLDIEAALTRRGLQHGAGYLRGTWSRRHRLNVPGTLYVADDDSCGTGPVQAPSNVILLLELSGAEWGGEFIYRQPSDDIQVGQVLSAAAVNVVNEYAADGNKHWTLTLIRDWWAEALSCRADVVRLAPNTKGSVQPSPEETWAASFDEELETSVRTYAFFVESGRTPRPGDSLPTLVSRPRNQLRSWLTR